MIRTLSLQNFLPFRKQVDLDLADQGLVLVRGANRLSAAADSNGSGKTSIIHGLSWALFGEDLLGRRADAVACRFTDGTCLARVDMADSLGEWSVVRTRRPAALTVYGVPGVLENEDMAVLQQKIEQRLGFGVRTFRNAVVFGQGAFDRFAQADQAEQMRMLDEIQGVDFREALARAKAWRGDLQGKADEQRSQQSVLAARAETQERAVSDLRVARDGYEAERRKLLGALNQTAQAATDRLDAVEAEVQSALAAAAELRKLSELVVVGAALLHGEGRLKLAADETGRASSYASDKYHDLEGRLEALLGEGACPSCRRSVKAKAAAEIRKLFGAELGQLQAAFDAASVAAKVADSAYIKAHNRYYAHLKKVAASVPAGQDVGRHVARLELLCSPKEAERRKSAAVAFRETLRRAQADIAAASSSPWSGAESLAKAEDQLAAGRELTKAHQAREEKIRAALALAEYWVEAFGDRGIRSMLVDGVADFVNERAAAHLEALAAGEATLLMSAQTELKKGGARERISFAPEWSWGGAGAGTGSGGQDRRMDLALFAAVQDLAESRSARPFPIKAWDEPADALDARGQELFVQWVAQEARRRGTGLLITHSQAVADSVSPDRVWTVVMTREGAHVEVE